MTLELALDQMNVSKRDMKSINYHVHKLTELYDTYYSSLGYVFSSFRDLEHHSSSDDMKMAEVVAKRGDLSVYFSASLEWSSSELRMLRSLISNSRFLLIKMRVHLFLIKALRRKIYRNVSAAISEYRTARAISEIDEIGEEDLNRLNQKLKSWRLSNGNN